MSRKARKHKHRYPPHWTVHDTWRVNGRHLTKGTEVSIRGERGRFRFIKAVVTPTVTWLDFVGGVPQHEQWRSFAPERVKRVHRIAKTRANNKEV